MGDSHHGCVANVGCIIINMDQSVFQFEDKSGSNLILTKCTCNKVAAKSMNAFLLF